MRRIGLAVATMLAGAQAGGAQEPAEGARLFISYCAACHGMEGRGDGEMAAILTILPSDLTQLRLGNGGIFPVVATVRQIDGRDPLLAHGGVMPLFGDFFSGEDVAIASEAGQPILTSRALADVVAYLETIQE
jgi:mono/diheme cytochrome c family protein